MTEYPTLNKTDGKRSVLPTPQPRQKRENVTKNPKCYMKCSSNSEHTENKLWITGKAGKETVFWKRDKNDSV